MSHTDMGIVGATTDGFILFENGVWRNRLVLRLPATITPPDSRAVTAATSDRRRMAANCL
jgi:hypothetical protein